MQVQSRLTAIDFPAIAISQYDGPGRILHSPSSCHRRPHAPEDSTGPESKTRQFPRKRHRPVRLRHRGAREGLAAHHLSSHGHLAKGGVGGGPETRPVAMVSPQRKRNPGVREDLARSTLSKRELRQTGKSALAGVCLTSRWPPAFSAAAGVPARLNPLPQTASREKECCSTAGNCGSRTPQCLRT